MNNFSFREKVERLKEKQRQDGSINWNPYYYILPIVMLYALVMVFPLIYAFLVSLQDFTTVTQWEWVGLDNYYILLTSGAFWASLRRTIYYSIGTTVLPIIIGLGLALLLKNEMKYNTVFRSLIFLPYVVPIVVVGILYGWIFTEFGIANATLVGSGLISSRVRWLGSATEAMSVIITMATWRGIGFNMVIFLAGLESIPDELYEAAKVQGKSKWHTFRYVTLPLLKPSMIIALILGLLAAIQGFAEIWVMTEGGPGNATQTLGVYFYELAFVSGEFGIAAALGFVMFAIGTVLSLIIVKYS